MLQKRKLGPNLETTCVGFGGGSISGDGGGYGFGNVDEKEACEVLEHAFERGIRLFDTAPIYGMGNSEKRIGLALSKNKEIRKQMTIVTKLGVTWDSEKKVRIDNSPDVAWRMLEQSLKDLQTDYVDVFMIHWPDPNVAIEQTMEALLKMKEQGLIRATGASNFSAELVVRAQKTAPLDVLQGDYSLFDNKLGKELFPLCRNEKKGFMSYGTLAKGMLAGSMRKGRTFDANDYRAQATGFQKTALALEECIQEFEDIARTEVKVSPAQLAVAWVLSQPEVSVALCGSKNKTQIDEVVNGASVVIAENVREKLRTLSEKATPIFLAKN